MRITQCRPSENFYGFLLIIATTLCVCLSSTSVFAAGFDFPPADFNILSANGSRVIGHGHYEVTTDGVGFAIAYGEDRYVDGEYDVERDRLQIGRGNQVPRMVTFEHTFFRADGSIQRLGKADFHTGHASCVQYDNGKATVKSATLSFPPDTYSGAVIAIPLQHYLAAAARGPITLHAFNCIPGPAIVEVQAYAEPPSTWSHYPGRVVDVDIKPNFGWINGLVSRFVPDIHVWFKPSENWHFVGGQFTRFFRGPEIILARVHADKPNKTNMGTNQSPVTSNR
jgi:hypothetical protein